MNTQANEVTNGAQAKAPKAKTEVEVVKMASDGREVEFAGKRKMVKETFLENGELSFVRFDFRNGESRSWSPPNSLLGRLAGHGAEQKIGDETAGEDDIDDMVLAVDNIIARLDKGEWTMRREGGMSGTSVLIKALMEYSSQPLDKIKAYLEGKSQAEKLALRTSAKLKPIVDRIEAEKASKAAHVDTDALLAGLPVG